ncbi:MAG: glutamate--tRNA ligase, partial [Candidatus Wallbacteria bacterium]|nr:glutamate--tRNA ligase [Candidatus Wallbacteria bacterium]
IEDTDEARSTTESERTIIEDLHWCGIEWEEGPDRGGPHGPYRQSERQSLYRKMALSLVEAGKAYYCFCTDEELEKKREASLAAGGSPHYDGTCRHLTQDEANRRIASGEQAAIRFHVPEHDIRFRDLVRGDLCFEYGVVGDFIILRSSGMPIYNFAVVVDDIDMRITHIFRGEEHLSNTPRQIMLYEAFGIPVPEFGHLSILLGEDRQKLSKRHGATSVAELRRQGFLPAAILNYLFLLGWAPGSDEEFFTPSAMRERFSTEKLTSNPQIFDLKKLEHFNHHYLNEMDEEELLSLCLPHLHEAWPQTSGMNKDFLRRLTAACKSGMRVLSDVGKLAGYYINDDYTPEEVCTDPDKIASVFNEFLSRMAGMQNPDKQALNNLLKECGKAANLKGPDLFHPLRYALTGKEEGPGVYDIILCIGLDRTRYRINRYIAYCRERKSHDHQV